MKAEEFEEKFINFYVDFGYRAEGMLPDDINPASYLESEAGLDNLAAIALEHAISWRYFVVFLKEMATQADYAVAFNAEFDSDVVNKFFPNLISVPWLCAMRDFNWGYHIINSQFAIRNSQFSERS